MKTRLLVIVLVLPLVLASLGNTSALEQEPPDLKARGETVSAASIVPDQAQKPRRFTPCVRGMAGEFPCHRVDLLSFFPMEEIGGGTALGTGRGNDVWGWADPQTRREYVLAGRENGTAIVDITDPKRPVYLANLPSAAPPGDAHRIWRDIKVFADHAFVVSEGGPPSFEHGLQILDLTRLRGIDPADAPVTLTHDALYKEFETAHNLGINEDTGFAYVVGARNADRSLSCEGGLHMVNISDPTNPTFAGCWSDDGYIHDTQCVVYEGPDGRFTGREICINSNSQTGAQGGLRRVTVTDVTDKSSPVSLAAVPYEGSAFSHQGWLTEDQSHFLFGDEGDELSFGHPTRTLVWDVSDLTAPEVIGTYFSSANATDHNMYVKNRYLFQSNYRAGLRVLDLRNVEDGTLEEAAFFDVYPPNDDPGFGFGTWSNYPFFKRGVVAVHGYQGLWLLKPRLGERRP